MKKLFSLLALGLSLSLGAAHAADEKPKTAQQTKMGTCNKDATGKTGADRKAFMKECLSAKPTAMAGAPAAATSSPACEKSAADKKLAGAAKKSHIKKCMTDAGAAATPATPATPAPAAATPAAPATPAPAAATAPKAK